MIIIGDVHGKVNKYLNIIENEESSIQLGDFGFKKEYDLLKHEIDKNPSKFDNHKICFGNHDYYPYLNESFSLGDFSFYPHHSLMSIRGAYSIDKHSRIEGKSWFSNEELDYPTFQKLIDNIEDFKPNIIVSHECPSFLCNKLFNLENNTRTSKNFDFIFNHIHKPKFWIFGHHHKSIRERIFCCNFIGLSELEIFKLSS